MSAPAKLKLTIDTNIRSTPPPHVPTTPTAAFTPSRLSHAISAPPITATRATLKKASGPAIVVPLDSSEEGAIVVSRSFSNASSCTPSPKLELNGSNSAPLPHRKETESSKVAKLTTQSEEEENFEDFNKVGSIVVTAIDDDEELDKLLDSNQEGAH